MRVLLVNHTALMGGAELALVDLMEAAPSEVDMVLACPEGPLADAARGLGIPVSPLAGTDASLRLGLARTARGLAQLTGDSLRVLRTARRARADVIHANSIRAGLVAGVAGILGAPPAAVQIHDCLPGGVATATIRRFIDATAKLILANSRYTATAFSEGGLRTPVQVVFNGIDLERFAPERLDRPAARRRLGIDDESPCVGLVAQITPWKGHAIALEALAMARDAGVAASMVFAGEPKFVSASTRYDNTSHLRSLEATVKRLGLDRQVSFLGHRDDTPDVIGALDLLLVPSWEEPLGRVVLEAMALGVPVVATNVGGPAEVIDDGREGLLLPPRRADLWAEAMLALLGDSARRARMGEAGRAKAGRFDRRSYARSVVDGYRGVLDL